MPAGRCGHENDICIRSDQYHMVGNVFSLRIHLIRVFLSYCVLFSAFRRRYRIVCPQRSFERTGATACAEKKNSLRTCRPILTVRYTFNHTDIQLICKHTYLNSYVVASSAVTDRRAEPFRLGNNDGKSGDG